MGKSVTSANTNTNGVLVTNFGFMENLLKQRKKIHCPHWENKNYYKYFQIGFPDFCSFSVWYYTVDILGVTHFTYWHCTLYLSQTHHVFFFFRIFN